MRTLRRSAQRIANGRDQPVAPSARIPRKPSQRFHFVRETLSELKKVTWPTRRETTNLTIIVIIASLAVGLLLGATDWAFTHLIRLLLGG